MNVFKNLSVERRYSDFFTIRIIMIEKNQLDGLEESRREVDEQLSTCPLHLKIQILKVAEKLHLQ